MGGQAEAVYKANDLDTLKRVIAYLVAGHIPYVVVGKGSNLLVKDAGLKGVVILFRGAVAALEEKRTEELTVLAGAGLGLDGLLNYCRNSGLGGLEFLAGIPGTVGGAIVMNSGAFGSEIGTRARDVHLIVPPGELVVMDRSKLEFSYRALCIEPGSVIVRVRFKFDRETEEIVAKRIADFLARRKKRQPLEYPSAGSVFKNPPGDYAGRLIENAGLKGKRVGGAMISDKHCNFIVNTGGATAKDILELMRLARETVKRQAGIELEPEIRVMGK